MTAPLDAIAESAGELIIATRRLAVDLLAEDGVSDVASLTAAGELDPRGLLNELARLARAWAPTRGIALAG